MLSTLSFPKHIQLQTHGLCNLACHTCPHPDLDRNSDRSKITWNLFKSIIDECAAEPDFESIVLDLQNEPLIDRDLVKKIIYIKERTQGRTFVGITTNGLLLSREVFGQLVDAGIDRVVVSLNATNQRTFERLTGSHSFPRLISNINEALKIPGSKDILKLSFGVTHENLQEVNDFMGHMEAYGIQYRVFSMHDRIGTVSRAEFLSTDIDPICHLPLYSMAIFLDGTVVLCCQDWLKRRVIGNVATSTIKEVWNGLDYDKIRDNILKTRTLPRNPCNGCNAPQMRTSRVSFNVRQLTNVIKATGGQEITSTTDLSGQFRWITTHDRRGTIARDAITGDSKVLTAGETAVLKATRIKQVPKVLETQQRNSCDVGEGILEEDVIYRNLQSSGLFESGAPYAVSTISLPRKGSLEVEGTKYPVLLSKLYTNGITVIASEILEINARTNAKLHVDTLEGAIQNIIDVKVNVKPVESSVFLELEQESFSELFDAFSFESPYSLVMPEPFSGTPNTSV